MHTKRSMIQIYLVSMLLLAIIPSLCIGYFWISQQYRDFDNQSQQRRAGHIEERRQQLHTRVTEIIDFIRFEKSKVEQRLRKTVKAQTMRGLAVVRGLDSRREGESPQAKKRITNAIVDALRQVRGENSVGWYVLFNSDGTVLLNPEYPEMENNSGLDIQEFNGRYVFRDAIALAKSQGEGFYDYESYEPTRQPIRARQLVYIPVSYTHLTLPTIYSV